jgi:ribosome recycling factor
MVIITREQAIRISYHKPYDKSKASELLKAIENINVELCYKNDP